MTKNRTLTLLANFCFIVAGTTLLSGLARAMDVPQIFWATALSAAVSTLTVVLVRRRLVTRRRTT